MPNFIRDPIMGLVPIEPDSEPLLARIEQRATVALLQYPLDGEPERLLVDALAEIRGMALAFLKPTISPWEADFIDIGGEGGSA